MRHVNDPPGGGPTAIRGESDGGDLACRVVGSPVGALTLLASAAGLVAILWPDDPPDRVRLGPSAERRDHGVLDIAQTQLAEFFDGRRQSFNLPLDMVGTDFQKSVWSALGAIPYSETRTYGALAARIGRPGASRAVGAACGRNPLSIVVPCHRAVGADGSLTGFAGGLDAKRRLLALEASQTTLAV